MSLLIDAREVRPLVVGPAYDGLSLQQVTKDLRLTRNSVVPLVREGYLDQVIVKNPVTG